MSTDLLPESLAAILITLALSFLIGLEREEHYSGKYYNFGGVRTFPIIGLCGYLMARLTGSQPLVLGIGVLVIGSLLWLSYRKKLEISSSAGLTSEVSGLFTFLMGALVFQKALWEATALTVIVLLLLELKTWLENLARKVPADEIYTFTRFLLIFAVILPVVPNRDFTSLHVNPFHAWLIVVVISGISYLAYIADVFLGRNRGLVLTAIFGGIYSSTSTTLVLAKKSREEKSSQLYSAAIIIASGFMYFRLIVLLSIFNWKLAKLLFGSFLFLGLLLSFVGGVWTLIWKKKEVAPAASGFSTRNPLELKAALLFALLFSLMSVLSVIVTEYFGSRGIYYLSFFSGLLDVDPLVMSLTQGSGSIVSEVIAAKSIIVATASNNFMKGLYAAIWGDRSVRKEGSLVLIAVGLVSLLALLFI